LLVDGNVDRVSGGEELVVPLRADAVDFVLEKQAGAFGLRYLGDNAKQVVVSGRFEVATMRFDDGKKYPLGLDLSITHSVLAKKVRSAHFEPVEVMGVVGHAHLVGLAIPNSDLTGCFCHG
jgi:hypothetical protein